jgi:acetoin utilization protein AcuC
MMEGAASQSAGPDAAAGLPPRAVLVYSPKFSDYDMGAQHPMKPIRLVRTYELIKAAGLLSQPNVSWRRPRRAARDALALAHSERYLTVVRLLSRGALIPDLFSYGLGTGDNPVFPGMYEASALAVGGTVLAVDLVAEGRADVAFNIGGGLHHAHRERAAGFCVFNDPAIGIEHFVRRRPGTKVVYIDIDAHHGDGVEEVFYERRDVLTISLHESGHYLFPGSGFVESIGEGEGRGFSVNLPLPPGTHDAAYLRAFEQVVPPLLEAFAPDLVVTQLGIDSHFADPLTHLQLTLRGYAEVVSRLRQLSPRWVAVGGGGYNMDVVPRAWTIAFASMAGVDLPNELPEEVAGQYQADAFFDATSPAVSREEETSVRALIQESVDQIRRLVFPHHGL